MPTEDFYTYMTKIYDEYQMLSKINQQLKANLSLLKQQSNNENLTKKYQLLEEKYELLKKDYEELKKQKINESQMIDTMESLLNMLTSPPPESKREKELEEEIQVLKHNNLILQEDRNYYYNLYENSMQLGNQYKILSGSGYFLDYKTYVDVINMLYSVKANNLADKLTRIAQEQDKLSKK